MSEKIEDFGKKIGGARKDLWAARGMIVNDLNDMNDAEINKYVTKNNIWKTNTKTYQAMLDEGKSRHIVYFIKTVHDALPTRPIQNLEAQKNYINFVQDIRNHAMEVDSDADIESLKDYIFDTYTIKNTHPWLEPTDNVAGILDNKLLRAVQTSTAKLKREVARKQFLYSDAEKSLSKFDLFQYNENIEFRNESGKACFVYKFGNNHRMIYYPKNIVSTENKDIPIDEFNDIQKGKWFAMDKHGTIIFKNMEFMELKASLIEYDKKQQPTQEKPSTRSRKKGFVPPQLEHIKRTGEDYRNGHIITGEDMLNKFHFYGGEFGNWLNENDRQTNLNMSYDAFVDLAYAMDIPVEDISMNEGLSIAYGSRGQGSAVAHYEPERNVINLTKMKGAGSLAHEYGHALDHYLGNQLADGHALTEKPNETMKNVLDTMKYKVLSVEDSKAHLLKLLSYERNLTLDGLCNVSNHLNIEGLDRDKWSSLLDEYLEQGIEAKNIDIFKETFFNKVIGDDEYSQLKVNILVKKLVQKTQDTEKSINANEQLTVETDFYRQSKLFDGKYSTKGHGGYWSSELEMFARAYSCYIMDRLSPNVNDYLCGHSEVNWMPSENGEVIRAFPIDKERKAINNAIDDLILDAKERGLFHNGFDLNKTVFKDSVIEIKEEPLVSEPTPIQVQESEKKPLTFQERLKQAHERAEEYNKEISESVPVQEQEEALSDTARYKGIAIAFARSQEHWRVFNDGESEDVILSINNVRTNTYPSYQAFVEAYRSQIESALQKHELTLNDSQINLLGASKAEPTREDLFQAIAEAYVQDHISNLDDWTLFNGFKQENKVILSTGNDEIFNYPSYEALVEAHREFIQEDILNYGVYLDDAQIDFLGLTRPEPLEVEIDEPVEDTIEEVDEVLESPKEIKKEPSDSKKGKKNGIQEISQMIEAQISIIDIANQYFNLERNGKYSWRGVEHDSFILDTKRNTFYWNSRRPLDSAIERAKRLGKPEPNCLSGGVITLYMVMNNTDYITAVNELRRHIDTSIDIQLPSQKKPAVKKMTDLERAKERADSLIQQLNKHKYQNRDMRRSMGYLIKTRKIDPEIVNLFIKRNMIYQTKDEKGNIHVAFVGRNENSFLSSVCFRSTNPKSKFKGDYKDCDYNRGWFFDPENAVPFEWKFLNDKTIKDGGEPEPAVNPNKRLLVFESSIEMMSYMSILKESGIDYNHFAYLSCGSITKTRCIEETCKLYGYKDVVVMFNNDYDKEINAGLTKAISVANDLCDKGYNARYLVPSQCNDWNDTLIAMKEKKIELKRDRGQSNKKMNLSFAR